MLCTDFEIFSSWLLGKHVEVRTQNVLTRGHLLMGFCNPPWTVKGTGVIWGSAFVCDCTREPKQWLQTNESKHLIHDIDAFNTKMKNPSHYWIVALDKITIFAKQLFYPRSIGQQSRHSVKICDLSMLHMKIYYSLRLTLNLFMLIRVRFEVERHCVKILRPNSSTGCSFEEETTKFQYIPLLKLVVFGV